MARDSARTILTEKHIIKRNRDSAKLGRVPVDSFLILRETPFNAVLNYNDTIALLFNCTFDFYCEADLHVIYGYLQIGEILTSKDRIADYHWHPRASSEREEISSNTLYLPTERLSFLPDYQGYGVFDYREDRVLTLENHNRGTWKEYDFLMPQNTYGKRKNAAKEQGLYYSGIWQEFVVFETEGLMDWVKSIIK